MVILQNATGSEKQLLENLHTVMPWKNEAPTLQIMDSTTWEALQALSKTGMISIHTRARRSLLAEDGEPAPPPLTPEELARIKALRETAEKKRPAAEALIAAGLHEEAEPFKKEAEDAEAEAGKIEKRSN